MKVLIVDNNSQHIPKILRLLSDHECSVVPALRLDKVNHELFDLIVLSGGKGRAVKQNRRHFKLERNLIIHSKIPVIGICLGAEMIADVYGAKIERMKVRRRLYNKIFFTDGSCFDSKPEGSWVFQMHKWAIRSLPSDFFVHASSRDGVEVFQHESRQLFGLQFHPEVRYGSRDGANIFRAIVHQVAQNELVRPPVPQAQYLKNRQTS